MGSEQKVIFCGWDVEQKSGFMVDVISLNAQLCNLNLCFAPHA